MADRRHSTCQRPVAAALALGLTARLLPAELRSIVTFTPAALRRPSAARQACGKCLRARCRRAAIPSEVGAAIERVWAFVSRPLSAPGPSDVLCARERRARAVLQTVEAKVAKASNVSEAASVQEELRHAQEEVRSIEDVLRMAYEDLEAYPVPEFMRDHYAQGTVNLAVTGASGVGKSSWINAIRRVSSRDESAAKTGIVETTFKPQVYGFSPGRTGLFRKVFDGVGRMLRLGSTGDVEDNPIRCGDLLVLTGVSDELDGKRAEVVSQGIFGKIKVKLDNGGLLKVSRKQVACLLAECMLWDLPGVGTRNFPQSSYLKDMGIRHFDLVVLITATRFTEAELMLMEELRSWHVPFFLVRSKIDNDVDSRIDYEDLDCSIGEAGCREAEEHVLKSVKEFFATEYKQRVYCVSSKPKWRTYFEFLELEQAMEASIKSQRLVRQKELASLS